MLVSLPSKRPDPTMDFITAMIASGNGNSSAVKEIKKGFYEIGHFSFDNVIGDENIEDQYPSVSDIGPYGVCDSPEQFIERYEKELKESEHSFIVSFTPILKSNQSPDGGWRWHKWGAYIGDKEPTTEYLYDEPDIDKVYCYHMYIVKK